MKKRVNAVSKRWLAGSLLIFSQAWCAEIPGFQEVTFRGNIVGSHGKPTNDVLGIGVSAHRRLADGWWLGLNLDYSPAFDFERPGNLLGIDTATEVDAVGTMLTVSAVAERRFALESDPWTGFWSLGAGINKAELGDAEGPIVGGGRYDIETGTDTEFLLLANAGWIQQIGQQWSVRYEFSYEYHFAEWRLRDRNSGARDTIDDYDLYGLRIGFNYRFE